MVKLCHLALATIFWSGPIFNPEALASGREEERDGEIAGFTFGGDCGMLARLSRYELDAITHHARAINFDRFCHTQGIYTCSDYQALLGGRGTLEENDNFGCNFVPASQ